MNLKRIFLLISICIILAVTFLIYKVSTFSIFDDEIKLVKEIKIPSKNYIINVYYIPSNASSQAYIQIRKKTNGIEEVLESFERYNYFNYYKFLSRDSLGLFISDTSFVNSEINEVKIKLP